METAFLQAIIAEPNRDDLRLIFADWIEERGDTDRAEFIRLQCARMPYTIPGQRETDLLVRHKNEWAQPILQIFPDFNPQHIHFERGFPCLIGLHRVEDLKKLAAIVKVAPIEDLDLRNIRFSRKDFDEHFVIRNRTFSHEDEPDGQLLMVELKPDMHRLNVVVSCRLLVGRQS